MIRSPNLKSITLSYLSFLIIGLVSALIGGCATRRYLTEVDLFGDIDLQKSEELSLQALKKPWENYPVRVIQGKLPKGLSFNEKYSELKIDEQYEDTFQIIGTITSKHEPGSSLRDWLWYTPLHEGVHSDLRINYCKAQSPLKSITLGLWALVPLYYPCTGGFPSDRVENLSIHIKELKRTATEMGANLVILADITDSEMTTITGTYGNNISWVTTTSETIRGVAVKAFVVKVINPDNIKMN
jgi:hypothetical protein